MGTIRFEAKLFRVGSWTLLKLPERASAKLPPACSSIRVNNSSVML